MRIVVDCRSLRKKPVGVANFLLAAINTFADVKNDWTFYLISNEDFSAESNSKLTNRQNVSKLIRPLVNLPNYATLWYLLEVRKILKELRPDYFYTPIPNIPFAIPRNIKTLITIHDMVFKLYPKTMSRGNYLINMLLHDRSIVNADKIWTISSYTKAEVERMFPSRKSPQIIVGTAIDKNIYRYLNLSSREKLNILNKYGNQSKVILTVGTLEPRKNLTFLCKIAQRLASKGFALYIVGAQGWRHSSKNAKFSEGAIKFVGYISDVELVQLYNAATVFVSTSLNEGFCMPLLEAMTCGCPVVASHNSAMIEVVEGAGETVKSWDENDWIATIEDVSKNREFYVSRGLAKSTYYSWKSTITEVAEFLTN